MGLTSAKLGVILSTERSFPYSDSDVRGTPMPEIGPSAGTSWQQAFPADAVEARAARNWAAMHAVHPDARQVAGELFLAVLGSHSTRVRMTVSTAGPRRRITASGAWPLALRDLRGAGQNIIRGLSTAYGITPDDCGLWAEIPREAP